MTKKTNSIALFLIIYCAFFIGCAKNIKTSGEIIATVNKDPVYLNDLKREISIKLKSDPSFTLSSYNLENELDNIINRRLLIQQAQKLKLDRTQRFIDTIKVFWEQTLIRDLVFAKKKMFQDIITVSAEEVRAYYDKLAQKVTMKVVKRKEKAPLEKLFTIEKDLIAWDETIGPLSYNEISSSALQDAFTLPEGESRVFYDGEYYYLVYMARKEPAPAPPIKEVYSAIEKRIKDNKENQAVRGWLNGIKSKAKVEVNKKAIKNLIEKLNNG